jgi:hypothetical protein
MRNTLLSIGAATLLGLTALAPQTASAVTCGDFPLDAASACAGPFSGNDTDNVPAQGSLVSVNDPNDDGDPADALFGVAPDLWALVDRDNGANESDELFLWLAGPNEDPTDAHSGSWHVASSLWDDFGQLMVVVKASNEFSAFLLAPEDLSGSWGSSRHGLSHLTLYGVTADAPPPPPTDVPEPGSLALLGLGLAGMGMARRRKAA